MHKNSCCNFLYYILIFADCLISVVAALSVSVICVVFILSGAPINPSHSLLENYFLIPPFDKCFCLVCFTCFLREQIVQ